MTDILVVDDDPVFGELTLERFDDSDWSAAFHLGPFGTVNAVRAVRPRLVVLDVNMPGLQGTKMGQLIRRTAGMEDIRILLFSSMDQQELDGLVQDFQADAALTKSATRAELLSLVGTLLSLPGHQASR